MKAAHFIVLGLLALLPLGCSKQERALSTGTVISSTTLSGFKGDSAYVLVQSSALPALYDNFRKALSDQGLVRWDEKFDCNHFAALFIALSQAKYAVAAFQSNTKAQTLALGEVWYHPDKAPAFAGHAVVEARTEKGTVWLEPQTGAVFQLTSTEHLSIYFTRW